MSTPQTTSAVTVTNEPTIREDFDAFVKLDTQSRVFGVKASAALILSGVEGIRLREKYHCRPGGDRMSDHSRTRALMVGTWPEICRKYAGISHDTMDRRIKLAEGAAQHLAILREVLIGEADPRQLPARKQQALESGLRVLTDGKTQRQLMWDFGLLPAAKPKGGARGGVGRKQNAEEQAQGAEDTLTTYRGYIQTMLDDERNFLMAKLASINDLEALRLALGRKIEQLKKDRKL
jgi:hypothetical protein